MLQPPCCSSRGVSSSSSFRCGSIHGLLQQNTTTIKQTSNNQHTAQEYSKEDARTDPLTLIHIQKSLGTPRVSGHARSQRVGCIPLGSSSRPARKKLAGYGQEAVSNPLFPTKRTNTHTHAHTHTPTGPYPHLDTTTRPTSPSLPVHDRPTHHTHTNRIPRPLPFSLHAPKLQRHPPCYHGCLCVFLYIFPG